MMQGKTHENIRTIRPLKDGVIADFNASEAMINKLIKSIPSLKKRFFICLPYGWLFASSGITEVEMRAVKESAERVNGKEVYLIHEPMAAAIGIGIDIMQPKGNMIVDIGGGTRNRRNRIIGNCVDKSVKIAGDVFSNDIINYMRSKHNLYVGDRTAEKIKILVGAVIEDLEDAPEEMSVQGRDLLTGKPKQAIISHVEIAKALDKSVIRIEDAIMEALSQTPPELAADIYNTGIYLAGGGALLRGLDKRLSRRTDLPVYIAEDPLQAVVRGTGIALKNTERFKNSIDQVSTCLCNN